MGASLAKPIPEFSPDEIAIAVSDVGDQYRIYCDALLKHGISGSDLDDLDEEGVEKILDDLEIANRLHRRVLVKTLNKCKSSTDFVSTTYNFNPSTPSSELEAFSKVTEACFVESRQKAVLAGVHLVLSNGNQLSLDTKILKDGNIVTKRLTMHRDASVCSSLVRGGGGENYYKLEMPEETKSIFEVSTPLTYTAYILKNESGKRIGIVCMLDSCNPSDVADKEREVFLRKMAEEAEYQLKLRKHLLEKKNKLEAQIIAMRDEIVIPARGPIRHVLKSELEMRLSISTSLKDDSFLPTETTKRASHLLPIFQHMACAEERAHLSPNFFDSVDAASAARPPIPKNDIARCGAVEALGLTDIGPEDEIAIHLKEMVKMATQVFGFPNAVITFHNHETVFRIADYAEDVDIGNALDNLFKSIKTNPDGSRFLCQMPRAGAVCNWSVASEGTFVVQDLACDETFAWMTSFLPIRCYVGTAIKDSSGTVVAVLCLFDSKPRPDFEAAHEIQMEHLASLIAQSIENWSLTRYTERLENERKMLARQRNKSGPPKGMVAIVLTEIQGSSIMWDRDPIAMQKGRDIHDAIIKSQCSANWGTELETDGDSSTLAFHDPVDAFAFALAVQQDLFDAKWPDELLRHPEATEERAAFRGLRVKMAVHHGSCGAAFQDGLSVESHNYDGETKNLTKNLLSMAHGGQILASFESWDVASYFMGSILDYPQVVDQGFHVIQKGETARDGLITKRIIQLIPANLAFDYYTARKLSFVPEEERHNESNHTGRSYPPVTSLRKVGSGFHDAPFVDNMATIAFVNMSAVDDTHVSRLVNLIGRLLDGMPELGGYHCQNEMLAFHRTVDAVLFGLHLRRGLSMQDHQVGGCSVADLIRYVCIQDSFLTMGPHRTTGRADYFGKIVNRTARLASSVMPGSVCVGVVCAKNDANVAHRLVPVVHPSVTTHYSGKKTLKGIQDEIAVFECTLSGSALL